MCTTGVFRFADGGYALFKNKDFGRNHLDDRIWLDAAVFGVLGMTTWAGDDATNDEYSGFSIGANEYGVFCCDSNVVTLDGHVNYDVMTEVALREGTDVASAVEAVRAACAAAPTSWGNLLLIDADAAASVEIRGREVAIVPLDGPTARSNHHVVLGHHELQEDQATTDLRLASAQRRIATAEGLPDVYDLLASHDDGSTGVCNHLSSLTTVYSYVLSCQGGRTALDVVQGLPCSGAERVHLDIPFGTGSDPDAVEHVLQTYPSATKQNAALTG
jgi:hypothetical protein